MTNRFVGLFVMPVKWDPEERSKGMRVLAFKEDIQLFRTALKEIRLRKVMRPVLGGVEFFEFELSEHGSSWNAHCHAVLDIAAVDPAEVEITFKQLTDGRGWFSLPPDHEEKIVSHENIDRTAMYFAKSSTWSPDPSTLTLTVHQLDVLQQAIKGVQLVTMWGTAAAPKIPKGDRTTTNVPKAKRVPFFMYPDQLELVDAAITRASELSESYCRSHNLSLVCMNYLATNEFGFDNVEQRLRFIAAIEGFIGYKLIAWDPENDRLVHGLETLKWLARNGTDDRQGSNAHSSFVAASETAPAGSAVTVQSIDSGQTGACG